jgi:predicted P-loop ATPase
MTADGHQPARSADSVEALADEWLSFLSELTPYDELVRSIVGFAEAASRFDDIHRTLCKRVGKERLRAQKIKHSELVDSAFKSIRRQTSSRGGTKWDERLTCLAQGGYAPSTSNFINILRYDEAWEATIGRNDRSGALVWLSPPPWHAYERGRWRRREVTDADSSRIAAWLETSRFQITVSPTSEPLHGAIGVVSEDRRFDPVREYLDTLKWDGSPRLDNMLRNYFGASGADQSHSEYIAAAGSRTLISAVARVFEPGCKADHVLTLVGDQGVGKSSALKTMAGGDHFADSLPDLKSKDAADYLRGPWIVELSELDSFNRAELSTIKAFISRTEDRFRAPYGRRTETHPRRCIFIGTTNEEVFLNDATGNRRFWPVTVTSVDLDALRRDRDQLWAEAVHRYRAGEPWHFDTDALTTAAAAAQQHRQVDDVWQPEIENFVASRLRVTVQDVLTQCLELNLERCGQIEKNRVARVLRQLGWVRRQKRDGAWNATSGNHDQRWAYERRDS